MMKAYKTLFSIALISVGFIGDTLAQNGQRKEMESKIESVTIFTRGAEIQRSGRVRIPAGETKLVIPEISRNIDPNSLQVKGSGNFTILGVNHSINYLRKSRDELRVDSLEILLEDQRNKVKHTKAELEILKEEYSLLMANREFGNSNGSSLTELKSAPKHNMNILPKSMSKQNNVSFNIFTKPTLITAL